MGETNKEPGNHLAAQQGREDVFHLAEEREQQGEQCSKQREQQMQSLGSVKNTAVWGQGG